MAIRAVSCISHLRIDLEAGDTGAATIATPSVLPSASAALSGLTSDPARTASMRARATDAQAESAPPSALRQVGSYGGPALDALASGLSLAASRLSAAPYAAKLTGALSGAMWAGGAGLTQIGSASSPMLVTGANALGGVADVLSAVQPWISGNSASTLAYSSAAAWAVNGASNIVRAGSDAGRHLPSRVLQGVSGAANVAAAALAAAAATASQKDEPVKAANLGAASSLAGGGWKRSPRLVRRALLRLLLTAPAQKMRRRHRMSPLWRADAAPASDGAHRRRRFDQANGRAANGVRRAAIELRFKRARTPVWRWCRRSRSCWTSPCAASPRGSRARSGNPRRAGPARRCWPSRR